MSKGRRITRNGLMKNGINCWSKENKASQAYFSQTDKHKIEQNMRRKGNWHTQHVVRKTDRLSTNN